MRRVCGGVLGVVCFFLEGLFELFPFFMVCFLCFGLILALRVCLGFLVRFGFQKFPRVWFQIDSDHCRVFLRPAIPNHFWHWRKFATNRFWQRKVDRCELAS